MSRLPIGNAGALRAIMRKAGDRIPGGLADKKKPSDFDSKKLAAGVKVEMEHTADPDIATEIAMDHLTEDPRYYEKLKTIEKSLMKAKGGWGMIPNGKHGGQRRRKGNSFEYRYPDGKGGWRSSPGRREATAGSPKAGLKTRLKKYKEQKIADMQRRHKEDAGKRLDATLDKLRQEGRSRGITKPNPPFDFAGYEEYAARLPSDSIRAALRDIMKTLPNADAIDRESGTDNGGRYRDQASVFRKELKLRAENPAREKQGELKQIKAEMGALEHRMERHEDDYRDRAGFTKPEDNRQHTRDKARYAEIQKQETALTKEIAAIKKKPKITADDTPEFAEPAKPRQGQYGEPWPVAKPSRSVTAVNVADALKTASHNLVYLTEKLTGSKDKKSVNDIRLMVMAMEEQGRAYIFRDTDGDEVVDIPGGRAQKSQYTISLRKAGGWSAAPNSKKGRLRKPDGRGGWVYRDNNPGTSGVREKKKDVPKKKERPHAEASVQRKRKQLERAKEKYAKVPAAQKDPSLPAHERATVPAPPIDSPVAGDVAKVEFDRLRGERDALKRELAQLKAGQAQKSDLPARIGALDAALEMRKSMRYSVPIKRFVLLKGGAGWQPIPGGKKGGRRRRKGSGWEYNYDQVGQRTVRQESLDFGGDKPAAKPKPHGEPGVDYAWGGRSLGKPDTIHMDYGGTRYKFDHGIFVDATDEDGLFHVSQAGNPTKKLGYAPSLEEAKKLALRSADFGGEQAAPEPAAAPPKPQGLERVQLPGGKDLFINRDPGTLKEGAMDKEGYAAGDGPYQEGDVLHPDHKDEASAYVIDDYPYGRNRTKMRVWIETDKKGQQRIARQTLNPKTNRWNKPKKSTYSDGLVAKFDEKGHIGAHGVSMAYDRGEGQIGKFLQKYGGHMDPKQIAMGAGVAAYDAAKEAGLDHGAATKAARDIMDKLSPKEEPKPAKKAKAKSDSTLRFADNPTGYSEQFSRDFKKLKKYVGIKSIKQGYKGTGSKSHKRQIFTRFENGDVTDVWFEGDTVKIGGIYGRPNIASVATEGKSTLAVVKEVGDKLKELRDAGAFKR